MFLVYNILLDDVLDVGPLVVWGRGSLGIPIVTAAEGMHHYQRMKQFRAFAINGVDPAVAGAIVVGLYSLQPRNLDSDLVKVTKHVREMILSFRSAIVEDAGCWYRPTWTYWNIHTLQMESPASRDGDPDDSWKRHCTSPLFRHLS